MFSKQTIQSIISPLSNRSSLTPRGKKNSLNEKKILSSSEYLQLCKRQDQGPNEVIYDSLRNYEKLISTLQGLLILSQTKNNHFKKLNTFKDIKSFAKNITIPSQPLNEQEQAVFKPIFKTQKRKQCEKLAEILSQKQQQQRKAQQQFLRSITEQYQQDRMKQFLSVMNIQRILNRKVAKQTKDGFISLNKKALPQKQTERMLKNILTSSFMMISIKLKLLKQMAFKTLLKQVGFGSIADRFDNRMKAKGKALMALKQYPRMNLKRAFWRWHLSSTDQGEKLFKKASDRLVLYTNINKASFFYRLFNQVRVKQIKVDPKVKRMTVMFYLYTKIFFERPMRTFFEKTKIFTAASGKEFQGVENIVVNAQMREKELFKRWLSKGKQMRNQQSFKKSMMEELAKRIVQVSKQKKHYLIEGWKKVAQKKVKQNHLKTMFFTKILSTKSGRVAQAFNNWKMLPQKINLEAFKRISRFEKGLITFAQRTLKKAIQSFKFEYEKAQAQKKRAVIQLINVTQGGQKKYFNKWKAEVLQHSLYQRCQLLRIVFESMNNSLNRNLSQIFRTRQYNLREISILQRFLQHINDKKNNLMRQTFEELKENAKFSRVNKWFSRAAQVFALRSHITMQKSLWRLKTYALEKPVISQQKSANPQQLSNNNQNVEQQHLDIISKQNTLMDKIQEYKRQNQELLQQLEDKQLHLEESNKTVTILTLRINYMVMKKFVSVVEKVMDSNSWRCLNQGFDCVIEMANENYEEEHANDDNVEKNYDHVKVNDIKVQYR